MFAKFFIIILIFTTITISSCTNNAATPEAKKGELTCQLREDIVLDFVSSSTSIENIQVENITMRKLTAEMTVGIEKHILTLTVYDKDDGSTSFDMEKGEANAVYEISGRNEYKFENILEGNINFTLLNNNQWIGSFKCEIENKTGDKSVFIYNGIIEAGK